jgi:hypothetical protein
MYVTHWIHSGVLRIGNAKPLRINAGIVKKNEDIMACCNLQFRSEF